MRNENGGILRRLLLLGFIGWGGWWAYHRWWPENNPQQWSGRLENSLNRELSRDGFTDRDVLSQVRKEHSRWGLTWVETQRVIAVGDKERAREIATKLARVARNEGCSVHEGETSGSLTLRIQRFFWLLQEVTLRSAAVPAAKLSGRRSQVAFVIDDVAYDTAPMDRFAALHVPLTFAILPREKHARPLSEKAASLHFPVMLHLPMEPLDMAHNDPGPSGLYLKMTDQELKKQFDKNVASVPNIVGINNHMGSAFTENEPRMNLVMGWVKARNIYFLDSRTTSHSVVCKAAAHAGVPCLANETFLDNQDNVKAIEEQLDVVMALADKRGHTIAIGHYRRKCLIEALARKLPEFAARDIQIVALPTLYHR